MDMSDILEEYRKIKLKEELDKAMWNKYKPIKVEITYSPFRSYEIIIPVNAGRFHEFIKNELQEAVKNDGKKEMFASKKI